jgi:hypothetical protein
VRRQGTRHRKFQALSYFFTILQRCYYFCSNLGLFFENVGLFFDGIAIARKQSPAEVSFRKRIEKK